jgi:hypothetical protein
VSGQEVSFQTEVMALRSLTVASQPRTVLFKQGQDADPAWPGLEIRGEWDQMGSDRIDLKSCVISGYNKDQTGTQNIRVSFEGQTVSFAVEVRGMTSLQITRPPTNVLYKVGENLNLTGLRVEGVWEGFPPEQLSITANDVTGFNRNQSGRQTLRISYGGLTATFDVNVVSMTALQITQTPTRVDYIQGDPLDLTGLRVVGVWEGFPQEQFTITIADITGYNPNNVGIQHVTITKNGRSASFDVEVMALTSLELDKPPTKTTYVVGEPLNLTGIMLYANYTGSDPTKRRRELLPADQLTNVSGYDPNRIGNQQRVTITVRGISVNFFVDITAAPVTNTPTTNTPTSNTPTTNTPTTNTPATNTPGRNTPATNTPSRNTPATDTPTTNTPVSGITITISPENPSVGLGNPLQLRATVTGTTNTSVRWSVSSTPDGTGRVGNGTSINNNGRLTISANESAAVLYVTATSVADSTKSVTIAVTVIQR